MGYWKLVETTEEAQTLRDIATRDLPAENASEILYGILGCDDLFDRFSKARKQHPAWDVSSLVVNAVAEIYFTGSDPCAITTPEVVEILRDIVDNRKGDKRDYFYVLAKIGNTDQAMDAFAHWLDIRKQDRPDWKLSRDPNGYDFIAMNGSGSMFRLSAIDDYVVEIDPANADMYSTLFEASPAPVR